jgi:hypothetical protein
MIAKGVRFNAEKKQVGNYYSTKVQFIISLIYMQWRLHENYSQNCVFVSNAPLLLKVSWNLSNYCPFQCNEFV